MRGMRVERAARKALTASTPSSPIAQVLYRGAFLIRNNASLGLYSRTMPRALRWSWRGGLFLMSEVPLLCPLSTRQTS